MQIPIIARRGQAKPWPSVPRLNPLHPLVQGLKFYIYDAGGGAVLGLRRGGVGQLRVSANNISIQNTRFGQAIKYAGTSTASSIEFPLRTSPSALFGTAPWSAAMGSMNTGAPVASTVAAGDCDAGTNTNLNFGPSATTTVFDVQFNNGSTILTTAANTNSLNAFHTLVAVVTNSTTANIYCDGKLDQTSTTGTKTSSIANTQFVLNSGQLGSTGFGGGANGYIYYFAGWSRILSAQEISLLHTEPWCFLVYPEDDGIFSTLVGTSAIQIFEDRYHQPLSSVGRRIKIIGTG